jgi:hypothetical protein
MKWLKWAFIVMLVIAAVVVFSTKLLNRQNTFYYYPDWNAYYDTRHKNYIYSIDGSKSWNTITNSSDKIAQILGQKIVLHSSSDKIWLDNAEHRSLYAGKLNDLVSGFLKLDEEKRTEKKKYIIKDSTEFATSAADSLREDSSQKINNWIMGVFIDQNSAKKKDSLQDEHPISEENPKESSEDSTEAAFY